MGTTLQIYLDWDASANAITTRRVGPGANNSIAQAAALDEGDALEILRGNNWGSNGLDRVDFYLTAGGEHGGPSSNNWNKATGVQGDTGTHFNVTSDPAGSGSTQPYIKLTLQSNQSPPADLDLFYKVTMDNGKVLDPEVINKSGSSPGSGGKWVDAD